MSKENICIRCNKPVGNPVFTVCDDCWEQDDNVKRKVQAYYDRCIKRIIDTEFGLQHMNVKTIVLEILKEELTNDNN